MRGGNWFRFLKKQFDPPREQVKDESLSLVQAIWKLNSPLIITTNYDDVLRWAAPPNIHLKSWDNNTPAEQVAFLRNRTLKPTVWHLHGQIDNASNIILTHDSYGQLYPEAREGEVKQKYDAALETLRSLLVSHTFLFIGFSLDDKYFGMQLKSLNEIYKGATGPHYVLVREADRARGAQFDQSVQPIIFEDFGPPLLEHVQELGEIAATAEDSTEDRKTNETGQHAAQPKADYDPRHPVFFVPFPSKGKQVVGRKDALEAVRKQLTEGHRTAIGQTAAFQGLGGLGKTQLAVEYAHRYRDEYPNGVIWLTADQNIDAQLIELSEKARRVAPESEHKYKLDIAQQRLRTYSDCLLIFDNLEDIETIKNYLPEQPAVPHILVTSRTDQAGFTPVPINPLSDDLSLELLCKEAGREPAGETEEAAAREIAKTLGGLPLALELAGAYLHHRPAVSWQQYRELLAQNLKAALPKKLASSFTQHEADLYSTLKINEEVFEEEPGLRDILDLLTWSGSAPMGLSLMARLLDVKNPVELIGALGLGESLRLLQKSPDNDSYAIHRLVSKVRREEIPLEERQAWASNICQRLGDWFQELRDDFTALPRFEAEIDHLQTWQQYAQEHAKGHAVRLIWLQAYPPYHQGRYQESREWLDEALKLYEQEQESNLGLNAHLLSDLGTIYELLGNYQRALEYEEKALAIQLKLSGEKHPDTAKSYDDIGIIYSDLGEYKRALEYAEKALVIEQMMLGEQHPDTVNIIINKAWLFYKIRGPYPAYQVLDDLLHKLPNDHPQYNLVQDRRLELKNLSPGFRHSSGGQQGRPKHKKKKRR